MSVHSLHATTWQPSQFLSVLDLTHGELESCLALAASMKAARHANRAHAAPLAGRHIALLFDKPSLRTRSTFMIAVRELGGDVIEPPADVALGGRESIEDVNNCLNTDRTLLQTTNLKGEVQLFKGNKLSLFNNFAKKERNARGADAFHPLITTRRQDGPTVFYRGDHQFILSSRLTMTAQYTHISENWGQYLQNDGLFNVEYADVLGIPFDFTAQPVVAAPPVICVLLTPFARL